mmetsp:Transcript_5818/g.8505  ORF Transcript_5818/g.8505 Transcript_5818/m.8505 type:complete len:104 (+) Transcript_5818:341-652(+)
MSTIFTCDSKQHQLHNNISCATTSPTRYQALRGHARTSLNMAALHQGSSMPMMRVEFWRLRSVCLSIWRLRKSATNNLWVKMRRLVDDAVRSAGGGSIFLVEY